MSQKEISTNMNPPNILGEQPVQDEDMNLHKQPVEGEERSLSGVSSFVDKTKTMDFWPQLQRAPIKFGWFIKSYNINVKVL